MKTGVVLAATVLGVVTGCGPHEVNLGGMAGLASDDGKGGTYPKGWAGSAYGVAGTGGTYDGTGGYPTGVAGDGYGTGGSGYAGGDPTGRAGDGYGGFGGDPSESSGGSGGYGYGGSSGSGGLACASNTIFASDGCEDDDVLLGRAYQVCVNDGLALASVTFLDRCSGSNMSGGLDLTCCGSSATGAAGQPGMGGSAGR